MHTSHESTTAARREAQTLSALAGLLTQVADQKRRQAIAGQASWAQAESLKEINATVARLVALHHQDFAKDYATAEDESQVVDRVLNEARARAQASAPATR